MNHSINLTALIINIFEYIKPIISFEFVFALKNSSVCEPII